MSSPLLPFQFEHLGNRPFSFYPAILNIAHNEWLFRRATWSEVLVVNCRSGEEIWIPRRFLGEVSRVEDPVLIVGLNKELEYQAGAVWPYQRRVIEMPVAVGSETTAPPSCAPAPPERNQPAPVVDIRVPPTTESRIFRLVAGAIVISIFLYLGALSMSRIGEVRQRSATPVRDQSYLELTSRDDFTAVARKLGYPGADRWLSASGEIQYRALVYPERNYTVVLMGTTRDTARYIGTLDDRWRPLHSVELPSGVNTFPLLRGLKRF